jgi:hypothetical protein
MVLEDSPELEVWLLNQWAGTLRQRGGELQFQYSERWLAQPQAIALSQSLPLQAEPFTDQHCRPFLLDCCQKGNSGSGSPSSARSPDPMTSDCWRRSAGACRLGMPFARSHSWATS